MIDIEYSRNPGKLFMFLYKTKSLKFISRKEYSKVFDEEFNQVGFKFRIWHPISLVLFPFFLIGILLVVILAEGLLKLPEYIKEFFDLWTI